MNKRTRDVIEAAKAAKEFGWEIFEPNGLRRLTEHKTPEHAIEYGWWTRETYTECEFVNFGAIDGEAKWAIHAYTPCPWVERRDQKISIKKAIELLSTPKEKS